MYIYKKHLIVCLKCDFRQLCTGQVSFAL